MSAPRDSVDVMPEDLAAVVESEPVRRESRLQASTPPLVDFDDADACADHLRSFLIRKTGSVLRAWVNVFDNDNDQRISKTEFLKGMRELEYHGDLFNLFAGLDDDESGEITLDEIDEYASASWRSFRAWCTKRFTSIQEALHLLSGMSPEDEARANVELTKRDFCDGAIALGCTSSTEDLDFVFDALCDAREPVVKASGFVWLNVELKRYKKKLEARKRSAGMTKSKQKLSPQDLINKFEVFKAFLKKKFGNLVRAWRSVLSSHDHMTLPKAQFLKACSKLGYAKEAKDLWKALDKDDSGFASIDELDPKNAEILAYFKNWVTKRFGGVKEAFKAIDDDNTKFITAAEFEKAMKQFKFNRPVKLLFGNLDKDANGKLELDDIIFLESWHPLEFLLAQPNYQARDDVRRLLLVKTGRYMKAWRHLLDKDATNRCNWDEFKEACATLGYRGDTAGAWRAFDSDLSGYISLSEIDMDSSLVLSKFRKWANSEFGSVRTMFQVFDSDGSNSLSFPEFRANCRIYGYESSTKVLFSALDVDQEGSLSLKEVDFLDEWDLGGDEDKAQDELNRDPGFKNQEELQQAAGRILIEKMKRLEGSYWRKVDTPLSLNRYVTAVNRKRDLAKRSKDSAFEINAQKTKGRSHDQVLPSIDFSSTLGSSWDPTRSSSARTPRNRPPRPETSGALNRSSREPLGVKPSWLAEKVGLKPSSAPAATGGSVLDNSANYSAHLLDIAVPEFPAGPWSITARPHTVPHLSVDDGSQLLETQLKPTLDELLESSNVGPALLCSIPPKSRQRANTYLGTQLTAPKIGLYTQQ